MCIEWNKPVGELYEYDCLKKWQVIEVIVVFFSSVILLYYIIAILLDPYTLYFFSSFIDNLHVTFSFHQLPRTIEKQRYILFSRPKISSVSRSFKINPICVMK